MKLRSGRASPGQPVDHRQHQFAIEPRPPLRMSLPLSSALENFTSTATWRRWISLPDSEHQIQLRRAVIASTIGTAIEWYDFFLYSTVTGLVFAKLSLSALDLWVGTRGSLRDLRRGLCSSAGGRGNLRPLRRSHRPPINAHRNVATHGAGHIRGGAGADLSKHLIGSGHPHRSALYPRDRRRRRMGRLGAHVDRTASHQSFPRLHRVLAAIRRALRALSSPISRSRVQPNVRRAIFWLGVGVSDLLS